MKSGLVLAGASALAVVLLAGLARGPRPAGADAMGRMPEVVATATGPRMVLDEVVVRAMVGGVADARLGSGSAN